jgi:hypothetical protein
MGHHDWNAAIDCGGFTAVGGVDIDAGSRAAFTDKTGAPAFADFTKAGPPSMPMPPSSPHRTFFMRR